MVMIMMMTAMYDDM